MNEDQNSGHIAILKRGGSPNPRPPLQRHSPKTSALRSPTDLDRKTDVETIPGTEILASFEHLVKHFEKDIVFLIRRKTSVRVKINFRPGDGSDKLILPESPGPDPDPTDN